MKERALNICSSFVESFVMTTMRSFGFLAKSSAISKASALACRPSQYDSCVF